MVLSNQYQKLNPKKKNDYKNMQVVRPYMSEDLEEPIKKKYNELDDNELNEIDMVWKICFPKLNGKTSSEKGFSNDSIIWILKDVKKKEIKGFISGLESIELIKFLNSKGIEDLDLYSIRNWNGIFINNLCILPHT